MDQFGLRASRESRRQATRRQSKVWTN